MVKEGTNALNEYKSAVAKKRRKSHRLENLGIPVEELLKQQQELFAKVYFTQGCFFHMDPDQIFHPTRQKSGILITFLTQSPFIRVTSNNGQKLDVWPKLGSVS